MSQTRQLAVNLDDESHEVIVIFKESRPGESSLFIAQFVLIELQITLPERMPLIKVIWGKFPKGHHLDFVEKCLLLLFKLFLRKNASVQKILELLQLIHRVNLVDDGGATAALLSFGNQVAELVVKKL